MPRPTLRDVANAAGVGLATASRALRGLKNVSPDAANAVRQAAQRLHYTPDPTLARLINYRWASRRPLSVSYLAMPVWEPADSVGLHQRLFDELAVAVRHRGFRLLPLPLGAFGTSAAALEHHLRELGPLGLILPPFERPPPMDLSGILRSLPAVAIGLSAYRFPVPLVAPDDALLVRQSLGRILDAGFQRIGIAFPDYGGSESEDVRLGGALVIRHRHPDRFPVPLLTYPSTQPGLITAWFRQHQPDALFLFSPDGLFPLVRDGIRIPGDTAVVCMTVWSLDIGRHVTGMLVPLESQFRAAITLLEELIRSGTPGSRLQHLTERVGGRWIPGRTFPPPGQRPTGRLVWRSDDSGGRLAWQR